MLYLAVNSLRLFVVAVGNRLSLQRRVAYTLDAVHSLLADYS